MAEYLQDYKSFSFASADENLTLLHANNKGADQTSAQPDQRLCYSHSGKHDIPCKICMSSSKVKKTYTQIY